MNTLIRNSHPVRSYASAISRIMQGAKSVDIQSLIELPNHDSFESWHTAICGAIIALGYAPNVSLAALIELELFCEYIFVCCKQQGVK